MTTLSIRARFPLGVFQGHREDRRPDWLPDPARLHAALLNAAGRGSLAEESPDGLVPSTASLEALEWLENHAPVGIEEPPQCWVAPGKNRFIYRNVSSVNHKRRTEERPVSDGVALKGPVGWIWKDVPDRVADTITDLCADVAYLGEASSVVILEPGEVTPTLHLDTESSHFSRGGIYLRVPSEGRTRHLMEMHHRAMPPKPPTVASDKAKASEKPLAPEPANDHLAQARYRRIEPTVAETPWTHVILFEVLGDQVRPEHRVDLCVAMHRTLISAIGFGASSMVTGKYGDPSVPRPANRLVIQYLPVEHVARFGLRNDALALLIPRGAAEQDLTQLVTALPAVARKQLWGRSFGRRRLRFDGLSVDAGQFWEQPAPDTVRLWKPVPAVVPETRPVKSTLLGRTWTLADAGLLSLAHVWRDDFPSLLKGQKRYIDLRNQVEEAGAAVLRARTLGGRSADYVHRTHRDTVTRPWTGLFHLGTLADDTTLIAVGQSRHLGGGLLVPVDVPADQLQALGKEVSSDDR